MGILTTESKREVPDGPWFKSPRWQNCAYLGVERITLYVVPEEDHHVKIGSKEYFEILFDNNEFTPTFDANMESADPLVYRYQALSKEDEGNHNPKPS